MKIGFFDLEGWEHDIILSAFPLGSAELFTNSLTHETLPPRADFEAISIFMHTHITEEVLNHFPNLKHISTRSTGYDHIDLELCRERGISVSYVPGYGDHTVAEFAFGLLLSLSRHIYEGIHRVRESGLYSADGLRGVDLNGKIFGVIGTGRIGCSAAKIGKGFGMEVLGSDPFPNIKAAGEIGFRYVPLEELLSRADFISLHCPLTPETKHLLNRESFSKIKRGAYLINTSRGAVVETAALVEALKSGTLAGAALDVLEEEGELGDELAVLADGHPNEDSLKTLLGDHVLMSMQNVLITPHQAFNSKEALERILVVTVDNLRAFMEGVPKNLVSEK